MTDDRANPDERAGDDGRQRPEQDRRESRDRSDEAEPVRDDPGRRLGALDAALESHSYPATTGEVVENFGDYEVESRDGSTSVRDVLAPAGEETYVSADDVRRRVQGLIRR